MQNSKITERELQRVLKPTRCGHPGVNHHYRVHSWFSGRFSVLRCAYTLCQQQLVISNAGIKALVAR